MSDPINSDIPEIKLPDGGFQSKTPEYLLEGKVDSEKWMLQNMGKLMSFMEWAGPTLLSTHNEVRKTNGRVTKNARDIYDIKRNSAILSDITPDLKEMVGTKKFIEKVASSKITWICLGIFGFGIMTIIRNEDLRNFILKHLL